MAGSEVPRDPNVAPEIRRFLDDVARRTKTAVTDLAVLNAAQFLLLSAASALTGHRVFTVGGGLTGADAGAGSTYTLTRSALSGDVTAAAASNTVVVDKASSAFSFTGIVTPSQITADQNDYSPTGLSTANVLRLSSDAARNITGIAAQATGRFILLFNIGGFNITLVDESASSSAANRFSVPTAPIIQPDGSRAIWYDITSARWRVLTS